MRGGSTRRTFSGSRRAGIASTCAATTYGYDNRGDRTSATVGTGTPTNYIYDQAQRLTQVTQGTSTWAYTFDGDGTRQSVKIGAAAATPWTWDPTTSLLLSDNTATFIYGPGGTPIEQVRGTTATYLHQDQLGSTVLITTQAGATADTYSYDPYGKVATHTGTTTTQLQFGGQYSDIGTGTAYLRARVYDPSTAQFVSRDPLEQLTRSPYGYVNDNPLNESDWSGLSEEPNEGQGMAPPGGVSGLGGAGSDTGGGGPVGGIEPEGANPPGSLDALASEAGCPIALGEFNQSEAQDINDSREEGLRVAQPATESSIQTTLDNLSPGRSNGVRLVPSLQQLKTLFEEFSQGGSSTTWDRYPGDVVELPDGTQVGWRDTSGEGTPTIDVRMPTGVQLKVHIG